MSFTDLLNKMLVLFVYILVGFIANKSRQIMVPRFSQNCFANA